MKLTILGIKVTVSYLFCASVCLMMLCDRTGLFIPMLLAMFIHEMGHLLLMWIYDCAPTEIKLIPGSVQICSPVCESKPVVLILIAGPIINIIVFAIVFLSIIMFRDTYYLDFALVNLIYGVFNLLPLTGLDGGSALEEVLIRKKGLAFARRILNIITVCFTLATLSVAVFLSILGVVNYSVYILVLYLILSILFKF